MDFPGLTYLESSAWGLLASQPKYQGLIPEIKRQRVAASCISVAEAIQTQSNSIRQRLCNVMRAVHIEDAPLLEPPLELALKAGEAYRAGETSFLFSESGPCKTLRAVMCGLIDDAPIEEARAWLQNMEDNLERFLVAIKPEQQDLKTNYLSAEVLNRPDFLQLLAEFPPARQLSLSIEELRELCAKVDIWRAAAAALAYLIKMAVQHTPEKQKGKKRPGGADIWQAIYLGIAGTFVTEDIRLLQAVSEISLLLPAKRRVIRARDYFNTFVLT